MAWLPRLSIPMRLPKRNWTHQGPHAQQTNGHFVCLLGFWPGLSSIRQLRIFSSGIRALHTDQGFLDQLVDCLWLQRVVHDIKCCQDPLPSTRLLIMDELMLVIWQCLDLSLPDHQLLWGTSASWAHWSSQCLICLATLHPSTSVSWTLQWILHRPHHPCAYKSRAPSRNRPRKCVLSTLALAGILSVQCTPWRHALLKAGILLAPLAFVWQAASHPHYS